MNAIPYLIVRDAAKALAFCTAAFGAEETTRLVDERGRVAHAELEIQGARVMLADEHPELGIVGPQTLKGTTVSLHVYVPDVDAFAARAQANGAELERPIADEFYGERVARIRDPFGHKWAIATKKEDIGPEEMKRRYAKLFT